MWRALTEARGVGARDQIWEHPDLLPTADDLDDPEGFVHGRPELDLSGLTDADGAHEGPADGTEPDDAPGRQGGDGPDASDRPGDGDRPGDRDRPGDGDRPEGP